MMRSLYSGVAGLKTHQTKMDVIGNNIANVNTVGFKSSATNFQDTFYQTVSSASGASTELRVAGTNAKQIGLGSSVAAIQVNITEQGGPSTTNRALDLAINGESFLVVRSGGETLFTKSGALNVDEAGNLYCTTNGATVQGWLADRNTGEIIKDTVKDLVVMDAETVYYPPEETRAVTMTGNIDPNDPDLAGLVTDGNKAGEVMTFSFFDNLGAQYSVKLRVTKNNAASINGLSAYDVRVIDVLNSDSESIFVKKTVAASGAVEYSASAARITWGGKLIGGEGTAAGNVKVNSETGEVEIIQVQTAYTVAADGKVTEGTAGTTELLTFASSTGDNAQVSTTRPNTTQQGKSINFSIVGPVPVHEGNNIVDGTAFGANSTFPQYGAVTATGSTTNGTTTMTVNVAAKTADNDTGGVEIYFDNLTQYSQGGTSKLSYTKGDKDAKDAGHTAGNMIGIAVDEKGMIYGSYDNGLKKCLGQICVATFANPSGLESRGSSLFAQSLNSGAFDDIGEEVSLSGSFTVGALEMSNVDLANEFTQMITTQRGFQANSRIITTSDSMLEELVNLKR